MPIKKNAMLLGCLSIIAGNAHNSYAQTAATPYNLGVYVGNPNGSNAAAEALFEQNYNSFAAAMHASPAYILSYVDYTQTIANWPSNASWQAWSNAQSPIARILTPVLGLPMFSTNTSAGSPDSQLQAFASGQYDSEIQGVLAAWNSNGFPTMYLRIGWEMNLQGTPYNPGAGAAIIADWVAAYKHIVGIVRAYAAANNMNVKVVWNPGMTNWSADHSIPMSKGDPNFWPGAAYVDVVALDVYADMYPYSDGGNPPTYHDWATGQEDTSLSLWVSRPKNRSHYWSHPAATEWSSNGSGGNALYAEMVASTARVHGIPFAIAETGAGNCDALDVCDDPTFPMWLSSFLARHVADGGTVAFVDVWDSNGGGLYEFSYQSDGKPNESAAWEKYFGD